MTSAVTIRPAAATDAPKIAAIHTASWRDAYVNVLDTTYLAGPIEAEHQALWLARLTTPPAGQLVLVAELQSNETAAFLCLYRNHDFQWGDLIDNLHVRPDLRGRRIGEQLMCAAASTLLSKGRASPLHLWVFEANQAGTRFYQRLGGEIVERRASEIPAANGAPVLRVSWPDGSSLLN